MYYKYERIEKYMRKYYIFIALLGLLVLLLTYVGFTITGGPFKHKALRSDAAVLADFAQINSVLSQYYSEKGSLPRDLETLDASLDMKYLNLVNETTDKPYDYEIITLTSYKLCTDFATESVNTDKPNSEMVIANPQFISTGKNNAHEKGYDCITYTLSKIVIDRGNKNRSGGSFISDEMRAKSTGGTCAGVMESGICVNNGCSDSDLLDIFTVGTVVATIANEPNAAESSRTVTVTDECGGTSQVQEGYCYPSSTDPTTYVNGKMVFNCPGECVDGACVK